jgi:hypothetical protein
MRKTFFLLMREVNCPVMEMDLGVSVGVGVKQYSVKDFSRNPYVLSVIARNIL